MSVNESVNIIFRSTGIPTIKREIGHLGESANRATRSFFLLQRAMYTIGGFGLAAALGKQLDALTNMENRLRLTTNSTQELESVQRELFNVAIRARTSWEGVTEIYNRAALSAKALGIAQKDVMAFTEGVSKASVISGAGAQEARAALIQLGQAVASNRLGGDELRSVLEQLPVVADYIGKYMTSLGKFGEVNRGNIRQLGKEGKITARIIIDSFKHAQAELDGLFNNMPLTIGQSIEIARSHWMIFLDEFDDAYNVSEKVAGAILLIAENIGTIAKAAQIAAVAVAGIITMNTVNATNNFFQGFGKKALETVAVLDQLHGANQSYVTSLAAEGAALRGNARSADMANASLQKRVQTQLNSLGAEKALMLTQMKNLEFMNREKTAHAASTGRFVNAAKNKEKLAALTIALSALEAKEATQTAYLSTLRQRGAAQQAAAGSALAANAATLAAANLRLADSGKGVDSWTTRMATRFPILSGIIMSVRNALNALTVAAVTNPFTALLTAAVVAAGLFYQFGNSIKVTEDGVVGLKDAFVAAFQLIWEKVSGLGDLLAFLNPLTGAIKAIANMLGYSFSEAMSAIGSFVYDGINKVIGFFVFAYETIVHQWQNLGTILPDALSVAWNGMLAGVENFVNGAIEGVQSIPTKFGEAWDWIVEKTGQMITWLGDAFADLPRVIGELAMAAGRKLLDGFAWGFNKIADGLSMIGISITKLTEGGGGSDAKIALPALPDFSGFIKDGKFSLDQFKTEVSGSAAEAARLYGESFNRNMSRDFLGEAGKAITDRARENLAADAARKKFLQDQQDKENNDNGGGGGKGKGGAQGKDFAGLIAAMNQEAAALRLTNKERTIAEALMKMEQDLKRGLTATEKELAVATIQNLESMKLQASIYEEINGPREKAMEQMVALNALYADGRINLEQYTEKMREFKIAAEEASGTLMGGFKAAIGSAMTSAKDFGKAIGGEVVGFVNSAADAIVEFAKTGKMNLKSLFAELFANLLKLAAQRLLMQALGGFLGFSGGGSIGPQPVMGFSGGGSIMPNGPGSTDSQIVQFAKRPDERVDILTPGQQAAQQNNMNQGGGQTVVQSPPVNVAAVLSPSDIAGAFDEAGETVLINMLTRNSNKVKKILG